MVLSHTSSKKIFVHWQAYRHRITDEKYLEVEMRRPRFASTLCDSQILLVDDGSDVRDVHPTIRASRENQFVLQQVREQPVVFLKEIVRVLGGGT